MASTNLFKSFGKAQVNVNKEGGYKGVIYYAPIETFLSIAGTTASPTLLGDRYKIPTTHTFNADEGFISLLCKQNSVTSKTTSEGDDDAQRSKHTSEFIIYGDSAAHLEQFEGIRNSPGIWLLKDQDCQNGTFVQFGDSCYQVTMKFEFTGNTSKEGMKEYKVTLEVTGKKFFYNGSVTEKP